MRTVFMGTPEFAAVVLQKLINEQYDIVLVVSQPDRPVGRKKELLPTPVKKVAQKHHLPIFQPEKIKSDHQRIIELEPDIIITAAYGQMIPKTLLDAPRLGCINVHASLLPKYRGGAPIHQAIINGEKETGVTIMYMDMAMDTGDMISQASMPIEIDDDVGTMFEKLSIIGANLLVDTLPAIKNGTNKKVPQVHEEATYAYNIKREDERLDWTRSQAVLYNHIRGLNPWPVAYTTINGVNMKVFKSELTDEHSDNEAGTVERACGDGIVVVCGDGKLLRLLDIQLSGKKRMPIKALLNGEHPFKVGIKFGGNENESI